GGSAPYTFNWGGGITTEDRTGLAAGTYTVIITDANGCTATVNATVTQPAAIALTSAAPPQGTVSTAYSHSFTATGGNGSFTYAISSGSLPTGLTLATDGVLSGNPTVAGTFNFSVSATESGCNQSAVASFSLTINQGNQTIAFNSLPLKTFGDVPFILSGSSTSGLAINYISSNTAVATISGNTVTIVSAGTASITASQAGNANYSVATPVSQTLTVGKATATLAISGLSQSYDGTAKTVTVTTTPAGLSGVAVSYEGSSTAPSAAGTYAVVASLTNANYSAANATGSLVIGGQNQTISFAALANKTFGDAAFTLTATGGASANPVTYTSSNTAVATISGNTVTIVSAGT
ncbi:MBG domain-containing protein, partial [Pedobacter agri]|uniref:MBG domain-containing protein n=1 Tax=Pedobacter agri TaxID=454586 RepID=UPI002930544A